MKKVVCADPAWVREIEFVKHVVGGFSGGHARAAEIYATKNGEQYEREIGCDCAPQKGTPHELGISGTFGDGCVNDEVRGCVDKAIMP